MPHYSGDWRAPVRSAIGASVLKRSNYKRERESLISFVTPGTCSERKQKLFLHAHHISIRISRIIYKHFERPLFTIYTVVSLSHKNKMRLEVHKCPH
jgi:hypothetical protein